MEIYTCLWWLTYQYRGFIVDFLRGAPGMERKFMNMESNSISRLVLLGIVLYGLNLFGDEWQMNTCKFAKSSLYTPLPSFFDSQGHIRHGKFVQTLKFHVELQLLTLNTRWYPCPVSRGVATLWFLHGHVSWPSVPGDTRSINHRWYWRRTKEQTYPRIYLRNDQQRQSYNIYIYSRNNSNFTEHGWKKDKTVSSG